MRKTVCEGISQKFPIRFPYKYKYINRYSRLQ